MIKEIQMGFADISEEYKAFEDKFKPKKTTDDCYTPNIVFDAVESWVRKHYNIPNDRKTVRPFWPGGDYEREDYPEGCVVIDNPPFSILSKIVRFYKRNKIDYFLFAPALTPLCCGGESNTVICGVTVTYANGAKVNTSFTTNLGEWLVEVSPELHDIVEAADKRSQSIGKTLLPKYEYPYSVAHAARLNYMAVHGVPLTIHKEDAYFVRKLDGNSSSIFGGGFILSERAAAERAAAERAAAERAATERVATERAATERVATVVFELSPRELAIQKMLGRSRRK